MLHFSEVCQTISILFDIIFILNSLTLQASILHRASGGSNLIPPSKNAAWCLITAKFQVEEKLGS